MLTRGIEALTKIEFLEIGPGGVLVERKLAINSRTNNELSCKLSEDNLEKFDAINITIHLLDSKYRRLNVKEANITELKRNVQIKKIPEEAKHLNFNVMGKNTKKIEKAELIIKTEM